MKLKLTKKKENPLWHYNQILSLFNIKYPKRMLGKNQINDKKRQLFRKEASKYILDENKIIGFVFLIRSPIKI